MNLSGTCQFSKAGLCTKAVLAVVALMLCSAIVNGQPSSSAQSKPTASNSRTAPRSPEEAAAELWRAVLITCPLPGKPGKTATFYEDPKEGGKLYEFRDAFTKLIRRPLAEEDKLNGWQFRGVAAVGFSAWRHVSREQGIHNEKAGQWYPFEGGIVDNPKVFLNLDVSPMQVRVEQRNGRWYFTFVNIGPDFGKDGFTLETLSQAAAPHKSCAELTSDNPFALR